MKLTKKKVSAVLFSALTIIYLTLALLSLFMILVWSLPTMEATSHSKMIGYIIFSTLFLACSISLISCFLILYVKDLKGYGKGPAYLNLPLSIPLIILMQKKNNKNLENNDDQIIQKQGQGLTFPFLIVILTIAFWFGIFELAVSFFFLISQILAPESGMLMLFLPLFVFCHFIVIGSSCNLANYKHPTKTTKRLAGLGLMFSGGLLVYQDFMKQDLNFQSLK